MTFLYDVFTMNCDVGLPSIERPDESDTFETVGPRAKINPMIWKPLSKHFSVKIQLHFFEIFQKIKKKKYTTNLPN